MDKDAKKNPRVPQVIEEEQQVLDKIIEKIGNDRASYEASLEWNINPNTGEGLRAARDRVDLNRPYFGHFIASSSSTSKKLDLRIGKVGAQTDPQIVSWDADIATAYHLRQGEPGPTGRFRIFSRREIDIEKAEVKRISNSYGFTSADAVQQDATDTTGEGGIPHDNIPRLTRALERNRDQGFEDIVESIQPEQFVEIARSSSGPMLLDGVAGSGKTTVALHRIAYITSAQRALGSRVDLSKVVALGPSQQFINWSSRIKDSLGIGPLRYDTVPGFMWSWIKEVLPAGRIRFDQRLEHEPVRTPTRATVERVETAIRITCSMPESLRSADTTLPFRIDVPYKRENVEKRMNAADWKKFWRSGPQLVAVVDEEGRSGASTAQIHLSRARELFEPTLTESELKGDVTGLLSENFEKTVEMLGRVVPSDITGSILLLLADDADEEAADWIRGHLNQVLALTKSGAWSQRNREYENISGIIVQKVSEVTRRLEIPSKEMARIARQSNSDVNHPLSCRSAFRAELQRVGAGLGRRIDENDKSISGRELREGWESQVRTQIDDYVDAYWPLLTPDRLLPWPIGREAEDSDQPDRASLGVLCAAIIKNIASDDALRNSLSHIVVDEAQELSEAEILFLANVARDQSLTFVGDLRQAFEGHSDSDWSTFRGVLSSNMSVATFDKSYRSTAAITEFSNEILRRRGISRLAQPYLDRPGQPVEITKTADMAEHDREVLSWLEETAKRGGTMCVVVPPSESQALRRHYEGIVRRITLDRINEKSQNGVSPNIVVAAPQELKGLEFNHVAIVRADQSNYPLTSTAGAAIYVASTRATTTLHLFYFGAGSPYIANDEIVAVKMTEVRRPQTTAGAAKRLTQPGDPQQLSRVVREQQDQEPSDDVAALIELLTGGEESSEKRITKRRTPANPGAKRASADAAKGWSIFGTNNNNRGKRPKKKTSGWSIFGSNDD